MTMTTSQFTKFLSALKPQDRRKVVIKIETNNLKSGLAKSKAIMEKVERELRIQKLELTLKRLNLTRSWV